MPKARVGEKVQGSGGGDPNILKLGDTTRLRVVDPEMVWFKQHVVEDLSDNDQAEFLVCPGPSTCPLCRKPVTVNEKGETERLWPISRRFAFNVWDYDSSSVKVLMVGPSVADEFQANKELGYDPVDWDFRIHKIGSRLQTKYKVVRGDNDPLPQEVGPDDMHDLSKYDSPASVEHIFEVIEKAGYDYDAIEIPSFTEQQALEFVMPFGRNKGMTIEQILATDPDWAEWLHESRLNDGSLGDPVFIALQAAMEARGMVPPLEDAPPSAPVTTAQPDQADQVREAAAAGEVEQPVAQEAKPGTVKLRSPDGSEVDVPEQTVDGLLAAGFTRIEEPQPEPEAAPVPQIDDDTEAEVVLGGATVTLKVAAIRAAREAGTEIEVKDAAVEAYLAGPVEPDDSQDTLDGYDKPGLQDICKDLGLKVSGTKPELIARIREARATADDPPAQTAAPANGSPPAATEDREVILDRVKDLLANTQFNDYNVLLNLFDEVAGKRDISAFTADELVALEHRLAQQK